jgi:predicted S18 family serine protease
MPLLSQCTELGTVVNWTDSQATTLLSRTDIADIDSLVMMLSGLAGVSEQAVSNLRSLQVTDSQLQTYQQEFISIYEGFRQATQGFVQAADEGEFTTMEQSNTQIQTLANQELNLINQVNAYCGQEIIANN